MNKKTVVPGVFIGLAGILLLSGFQLKHDNQSLDFASDTGYFYHASDETIKAVAQGGETGSRIQVFMDKLYADLNKNVKNCRIKRVSEGVIGSFNTDIIFEPNSPMLKSTSDNGLDQCIKVLRRYKNIRILITNHTDSDGTDEFNQELTNERAVTLMTFFQKNGISAKHLRSEGRGESQPVGDNKTTEGKLINRRVDVIIYADQKLIKAAKKGVI